MRTVTFQSYGNNEIRVGWDDLPTRARRSTDSAAVKENDRRARALEAKVDRFLSDNKLFQLRDKDGTLYRGNCVDGYSEVEKDSQVLDIIREFQREGSGTSSDLRKGYGQAVRPTTFGRAARHKLLEAGALFDKECSETHRGYFATFTLPGSRPEAYDALSRWSGYLVNLVLQVVRRQCKDALWFYCWELQQRGALHLHLFIAITDDVNEVVLHERLRDVWHRALASIGDRESICLYSHRDGEFCTASQYWQLDWQKVDKSPAAYISKYVSKGAHAPSSKRDLEEGRVQYFPHRWHGMSRTLSNMVKEHRFQLCMDAMTEEECEVIVDCMDATLTQFEPVATQTYECEVGTQRQSGNAVGRTMRKIYWFVKEDFPIVDFLFRKIAFAYMQTRPPHLRRWKYDSVNYGGLSLADV